MSIILPVYASGGISQFHRGRAQLLHGSSVTVRGYRHRACPRSVTASRKSLENKDFYRPRHCASPRTVTVPAHSDSQIIHQTKRHPHRENDAIPARPNRMIRSPEPVAKQSETAPKSPSRNDAPPCAKATRPPQEGPAVEGDIDRDKISAPASRLGELVDEGAHPIEQVGVFLRHLLGELDDRDVGALGGTGDLIGGGVSFLRVE